MRRSARHAATATAAAAPVCHIDTPLIHARHGIDSRLQVQWKMENFQPSGSFKDRGISHMMRALMAEGRQRVRKVICSSGGNAGHAVATAGLTLNVPVDVYVPVTTLPMMVDKLRQKGATVFVAGANWNEADARARAALAQESGSIFVPPYDHELLWEGHSTIVDELFAAHRGARPPDAIVVSVGGGGLLAGVQRGLNRVGWGATTKVFGVETAGAASFAAAKAAGGRAVKLDRIATVASSLGALSVTTGCLVDRPVTESIVVTDAEAVAACVRFADDYKVLTEPACGAALAAVFTTRHVDRIVTSLGGDVAGGAPKHVVVVACGGSIVSLELLERWRKDHLE